MIGFSHSVLWQSFFCVAGCVFVFSTSHGSRPPKGVGNLREGEAHFVVGSFTLADLWSASSRVGLLGEADPNKQAIIDALKACRVYLLDKRMLTGAKSTFTAEQGYPKALVEGVFVYKLKDKMKADIVLHLVKCDVAVSATNNDANPPSRQCTVRGVFHFTGRWGAYTEGTFSATGRLRYTITGKSNGFQR